MLTQGKRSLWQRMERKPGRCEEDRWGQAVCGQRRVQPRSQERQIFKEQVAHKEKQSPGTRQDGAERR